MKNFLKIALLATALVGAGASTAASATTSTTITGSINFGGGSTNYYDSANGFVPAGYGNSAGATTVAVYNGVEFGFADGGNTDTADFSQNGLVLTDVVRSSALNWTQVFTASTPNYFNNIALTSTNFSDLSYLVTGNTLRVDWAGTSTSGTYTANFSFGAAAVPEPATWAMMLVGFGMMGAAMRYRRRGSKAALA